MRACGCVACGHVGVQMHCMWTRISIKKKKTYLVGCEHVGVLTCGCELDMDDCEEKEKKRKTYWSQILDVDGCGCGWWMVVVAQLMTQHV